MTPTKQTVYLENNSEKATHFLSALSEESYFRAEEKEGYFFTPEQLNEYTANVIKQALETAAENAEITNKAKFSGDYNPVVDEESITNTFEETYNKLKV